MNPNVIAVNNPGDMIMQKQFQADEICDLKRKV
jgi:hypothetical protein